MAKLFKVFTEEERLKEDRDFLREYNKVKDDVYLIMDIRVVKKPYAYVGVGIDKNIGDVPLQRLEANGVILKARQKYKIKLNSYMKVIGYKRI